MASKRTPEETLLALQEHALDDEMEKVLALTPEERRRELRDAGFDVDAEHTAAAAQRRQTNKTVEPNAIATVGESTMASGSPRRLFRVTSMLLAAAFAGIVLVIARRGGPPGEAAPPAPTTPAVSPLQRAAALRADAFAACESARWEKCRRELDDAKGLDPAGDNVALVQDWRRTIASVTSTAPPP